MVLVILGLKASDNAAFWTYGKKKKISAWLSKENIIYLALKKEKISLLNYQTKKVSTCSLNLANKRK
ncbi:hypothetical protein AB4K20DRAFT_1874395, partial [Rhizopus microsporus]